MPIVELTASYIFQEYRRACYRALATLGYNAPELYLERKDNDCYMSYWGQGNQRMEALFDLNADHVSVYELTFVS